MQTYSKCIARLQWVPFATYCTKTTQLSVWGKRWS